jgi:ABC-type nitrate/sulfonate/bicarbonate transport system substrate-binding protein
MVQTIALLASDSSHLPLLTVLKESGVAEKNGLEIELDVVGSAKAPTLAHRARLLLAGEVHFLSGLHHDTYKARAAGERRFVYLAQAQNNWDDRLVVSPSVARVDDLRDQRIICHTTAPCVMGNLLAVLERCGLPGNSVHMESLESLSGKLFDHVEKVISGEAAAALVDMPFDLYSTKKGLRILQLPDRPVIHNTTILCTTDYIKQNEETVVNFLKALVEAIHFFKTRPKDVVRILRESLASRYGLDEEEYFVYLHQ